MLLLWLFRRSWGPCMQNVLEFHIIISFSPFQHSILPQPIYWSLREIYPLQTMGWAHQKTVCIFPLCPPFSHPTPPPPTSISLFTPQCSRILKYVHVKFSVKSLVENIVHFFKDSTSGLDKKAHRGVRFPFWPILQLIKTTRSMSAGFVLWTTWECYQMP